MLSRRHALPRLGGGTKAKEKVYVGDVCVPPSKLAECISVTEHEFKKARFPCVICAHIADGNFHCLIPFQGASGAALIALEDKVIGNAIQMGGTASGEHGVGIGKQKYIIQEHGIAHIDIQRRIKRALDPHNIMNPGQIISWDPSDTERARARVQTVTRARRLVFVIFTSLPASIDVRHRALIDQTSRTRVQSPNAATDRVERRIHPSIASQSRAAMTRRTRARRAGDIARAVVVLALAATAATLPRARAATSSPRTVERPGRATVDRRARRTARPEHERARGGVEQRRDDRLSRLFSRRQGWGDRARVVLRREQRQRNAWRTASGTLALVVAAGVALQQGLFELDAPLAKYDLRSVEEAFGAYADQVSVRQLLAQTHGGSREPAGRGSETIRTRGHFWTSSATSSNLEAGWSWGNGRD